MLTPPKLGNVVQEFTIGNTRVKICDDFCRDRTPEDVDAILARIAKRAIGPLSRMAIEQQNLGATL